MFNRVKLFWPNVRESVSVGTRPLLLLERAWTFLLAFSLFYPVNIWIFLFDINLYESTHDDFSLLIKTKILPNKWL